MENYVNKTRKAAAMESKDYPYLKIDNYDNFYELLKARYEHNADDIAVKYFNKNQIIDVTYGRFIEEISCVYEFIDELEIKDTNIGIFLENRYEYLVIYLASMLNHVSAPMDKEVDTVTLRTSIEKFDIKMIFYSNKTSEKVLKAAETLEIQLINIDEAYDDIIRHKCDGVTELFLSKTKNVDKDKFAVLATTSGSDGRMKGVMLSQYNIINNIRGTLENNTLGNPTFAFLPMNHTYGMNPCILATFYNGTTVCLNSSMKYFARELKAFNPDFFGAVPMVVERIYENILREAKKQNKDKSLSKAIKISQFLRKFHIDIRHQLFGNLICDNLTKIVNGGAPLSSFYVERFDELGIRLLNGYGLTECSPTVAVSRVKNNVPGSAGTIMNHIEVKIADDGEILVKGPNVMLGYYKDEQATADCMENGYFKTGDIGYTIGRVIFITGRKKNLMVLENGKKASPELIEEKLNALSYVAASLAVLRKVNNSNTIITALIRFENNKENLKSELEKRLREDIKYINQHLPSYMNIDDYEIMETDFQKTSIDKIKRSLYV